MSNPYVEIEVLRSELRRAAEVIGAQTFDVRSLAKGRRASMVRLADRLLLVADGVEVPRRFSDIGRSSLVVRERFWEDLQ